MRNPFASERSTNLGILVARLALGASLLMIGYNHFSGGVKVFAHSNGANLPRWMTAEIAIAYSQILPFLEMATGGMLVLGLTTRFGGFLAAVITGIILSARGVHLPPDPDGHLPVYLALSFLLLCLGGGKLTLDGALFGRKKPLAETDGH
jgi:uncharacterized membrane protein YphA (DoxX/SURF4 family)